MRALPEVRIEDLLGREEIRINMEEIAGSLKGKVVLVTGAAGSIGSELCRQLCHFGLKQLVLFDSAETPMHNIRLELEEKFPDVEFTPVMGDIRMIHRVESIYQRFRPQYRVPCRRLQACAPDGREPLRSRPYECLWYA